MELEPLVRRPVVHQVADQLRSAVIDAINGSASLPAEGELSRALGVSRPTVREALRILEAEGLVGRDRPTAVMRADPRPEGMSQPLRQALFVLSRTERITLAEIVDLRQTLEERAIELAAEVATPGDLVTIEEAIDELEQAVLNGDDWNKASGRVHLEVVKASHNEAFLLITLAVLQAERDFLRRAAAAVLAQGRSANHVGEQAGETLLSRIACHRAIYQAIKEGRGAEAAAIFHEHWRRPGAFYGPLVDVTDDAETPEGNGSSLSDSQGTHPRVQSGS